MSKLLNSKVNKFIWPKISRQTEEAVLHQLHESISIYGGGGIFGEFEQKFAAYHHRRFALLCNSGTSAIHSMFVAAGFNFGDEVICPAYTFFATVTPLLFTGAKPILCDCDENGNIDPDEIIKKITKKTKAVVVTHMWGIPAKMDEIALICKKKKLLLLEDCSHAHGATYKKLLVGSFGDLSAWSLQGSKLITGGEGGILTTNNRLFYEKALLLGHYNKRCLKEIKKTSPFYKYALTGMGLKYRAHPLAVAVANSIFNNFEKKSKFRRKFAADLIKDLKTNPAIKLPPAYLDKRFQSSWYAFIFFASDIFAKKNSISKILKKMQNIGLSDIDRPSSTKPLNLLPLFQNPGELFPIYQSKSGGFSYQPGDFPKAEKFYNSIFKMPLGVDADDGHLVNIYKKGIKRIFS